MKARVYVSLKPTVLDPQGQTISAALRSRGYSAVRDVRQGKIFEIEVNASANTEEVKQQLEEIAREILANPVIEDYRVEVPN